MPRVCACLRPAVFALVLAAPAAAQRNRDRDRDRDQDRGPRETETIDRTLSLAAGRHGSPEDLLRTRQHHRRQRQPGRDQGRPPRDARAARRHQARDHPERQRHRHRRQPSPRRASQRERRRNRLRHSGPHSGQAGSAHLQRAGHGQRRGRRSRCRRVLERGPTHRRVRADSRQDLQRRVNVAGAQLDATATI